MGRIRVPRKEVTGNSPQIYAPVKFGRSCPPPIYSRPRSGWAPLLSITGGKICPVSHVTATAPKGVLQTCCETVRRTARYQNDPTSVLLILRGAGAGPFSNIPLELGYVGLALVCPECFTDTQSLGTGAEAKNMGALEPKCCQGDTHNVIAG